MQICVFKASSAYIFNIFIFKAMSSKFSTIFNVLGYNRCYKYKIRSIFLLNIINIYIILDWSYCKFIEFYWIFSFVIFLNTCFSLLFIFYIFLPNIFKTHTLISMLFSIFFKLLKPILLEVLFLLVLVILSKRLITSRKTNVST